MAIRLISSLIGIVVALVVLFLHDTFLFPLAVGCVTVIMLLELIRAVGAQRFYLALSGALLYGMAEPFLQFYEDALQASGVGFLSPVVRYVCLILVFAELIWHSKEFHVEQIAFVIMSMLLVPMSMCLLIRIKHGGAHGMICVILALCGAWIADSGAYFAGITLGRHKLCPVISPKKTVEGFIGGIICDALVFVLVSLGYALWMQHNGVTVTVHYIPAALAGMLCAAAGLLGDLSASVVKRQKGMKDYGTIMPGHGGLMDRFDSVLFVVPTFYVLTTIVTIFE